MHMSAVSIILGDWAMQCTLMPDVCLEVHFENTHAQAQVYQR